jgi:ParB family chromosome partitioning protein
MKLRRMGPGVPIQGFSNSPSPSNSSINDTTAAGTSVLQTQVRSFDRTRDIRELDIYLIDPNPLAPREVYTNAMIRSMADALGQGQHDAIHVIPNLDTPGRYIICDGWTRVQACKKHDILGGKLLAEIHQNLTFQESAWFGYQQNEGRNQHFDVDRGLFYAKLIKSGQSQTEIAKRANLSKTLMSFYLSYDKLPASVLDVIRDRPERFGATAAWHLAKYLDKSGPDAILDLVQQYAEEGHSVRWLAAQTKLPAAHQPTRPAPKIKTVTYANGRYELSDAQCKLDINLENVPPAMRSTFTIELEKLIAMVAEADATKKCED